MRNIEVVVDASGSADLNEIEKHLVNMKMDPNLENDKIQVSFYCGGEKISKSLSELEIPLADDVKNKLVGGGDNYSEVINVKLKTKPDVLVFVGDYMDQAIDRKLVNPLDTKLVFVCTQREPQVEQFYLAALKDLPNVRSTNTDKYTSLNSLFSNDLSIEDKLAKLRNSTNGNDSKLKP